MIKQVDKKYQTL